MVLGYLKSIEAVLAVMLAVFMLLQVQPVYEPATAWDQTNLQQAGENALLALSYSNELRQKIASGDYIGLNASFSRIMPEGIKFNLFKDDQLVINNGNAGRGMTSVVYFISGNTTYSPAKLQMQLWYGGN
ncbi:MAG: hypothetical protein QXO69_00180 [archaeon]